MADQKIRLKWDFRGPEASQTAQHFLEHLIEFLEKEKLQQYSEESCRGLEYPSSALCSVFLIVESKDLTFFKEHLKPHRAFYEES